MMSSSSLTADPLFNFRSGRSRMQTSCLLIIIRLKGFHGLFSSHVMSDSQWSCDCMSNFDCECHNLALWCQMIKFISYNMKAFTMGCIPTISEIPKKKRTHVKY